jgi:hypothetical protein
MWFFFLKKKKQNFCLDGVSVVCFMLMSFNDLLIFFFSFYCFMSMGYVLMF